MVRLGFGTKTTWLGLGEDHDLDGNTCSGCHKQYGDVQASCLEY